MRTKILLGLLLPFVMPLAASADQGGRATTRRADAIVTAHAKTGHPGCAVGIYQNGRTLYEGAYGLANLEHNVPIDPQNTVFGVGSVSKQFAAASVLLLAQDGKLKLDDDIRKYLPEMPDYGHVITIDHLLHHTSGLRDYTVLRWMKGESWWGYATEQDGLDLVTNQRGLNFSPGSKYTYSNTNYFLLALIVRRVSGKTLEDFARERIFAPLGMSHTTFSERLGQVTPHRASGYGLRSDGAFEARSTRWAEYGDSGVETTLSDLARWQRNFDEPKVGGAWLVQQLEQNGALNDGTSIEYARGVEVFGEGAGYHGLRTVVHNGGTWDGFRADVMRLTRDRLSSVVLCNSDDAEDELAGLRNQLVDLFMGDRLPAMPGQAARTPAPVPDSALPISETPSNLLGVYWNREDINVRRIEISEGKLWYVRSPKSRTELVPIENGQLQMLGVSTRTIIEPLPMEGGRQIVRVAGTTLLEKVAPVSSDVNALAVYAGAYASSELGGGRLVFAVRDGRLATVASLDGIETLTPVFKDAFDVDNGQALLVFQRDASGRVTSVIVDHLWARNMAFAREPE
jgi:CubicO group peptidase (beta-lactamase class C family)